MCHLVWVIFPLPWSANVFPDFAGTVPPMECHRYCYYQAINSFTGRFQCSQGSRPSGIRRGSMWEELQMFLEATGVSKKTMRADECGVLQRRR